MSSQVTAEDRLRVQQYLEAQSESEKRSALLYKKGFLVWLVEQGLIYLAHKVMELAWQAIKELLGLDGMGLDYVAG